MVPANLLFPPFPFALFEPFDVLLHAVLGFTVASVFLDVDGWIGAVGGLVPNLDAPLPIHHGGIMHTPFFLGLLLVAGAVLVRPRLDVLAAFAIGYLLELFVDMLQLHGSIMLLFPLTTHHYSLTLPLSELYWGGALYLACFYLLYRQYRSTPGPLVRSLGS